MKNYFLVLSVFGLISCGGNSGNEKSGSGDSAQAGGEQLNGAQLISKSDCRACHGEKETIIGPGYREVAEKYPENDSTVTYLAEKIISGGAGNWGDTPMPPHPQHSQAEAEAMARYILSLQK